MGDKANVTVSNPSHYAGDEGIIEPIDRIANLPFNFGSANKYLKRLGLKGGDNTEARDASSAMWYAVDLMHRFLAEEDGEYRPTAEDIEEFDVTNFVTRVGVYAESVEAELKLAYASYDHLQKRFVLAAQDMLIHQATNAIKIGMSDRQYRDFVLEAIVVSYYTTQFTMSYVGNATPFTIYKGSKSFPLTPELCEEFRFIMDVCAHELALGIAATGLNWGFGATEDHL